MNVIQYTGELVPVEWSERPLDGVVDLWLRKNPRTDVDPEGNTVQIADEAYMAFAEETAPTQAEVEADFGAWFDRASKWNGDESEILARLEAAEAKNSELSGILYAMMGVNIND